MTSVSMRATSAVASIRSAARARAGVVEPECVADQEAGIEIWASDAAVAATAAQQRRAVRPVDAPTRKWHASTNARPPDKRVLRGEKRCLVVGHQRIDDLVQPDAVDHLGQLVERQVDAMVGDAPLRKIVGADALGAVAAADLAAPVGSPFGIAATGSSAS